MFNEQWRDPTTHSGEVLTFAFAIAGISRGFRETTGFHMQSMQSAIRDAMLIAIAMPLM